MRIVQRRSTSVQLPRPELEYLQHPDRAVAVSRIHLGRVPGLAPLPLVKRLRVVQAVRFLFSADDVNVLQRESVNDPFPDLEIRSNVPFNPSDPGFHVVSWYASTPERSPPALSPASRSISASRTSSWTATQTPSAAATDVATAYPTGGHTEFPICPSI